MFALHKILHKRRFLLLQTGHLHMNLELAFLSFFCFAWD
jgi:hypothetical protein